MAKTDDLGLSRTGVSKGNLGSKAKKAGLATTGAFSSQDQQSPGKLGKQSRLAETLSKLRRKGTIAG